MRALAPVTGLFKGKQPDSGEMKTDWIHSNSSDKSPNGPQLSSQTSKSYNSANSDKSSQKKLRHQTSGEKPWWLDSNSENVPEGIEKNVGNDDVSQETTVSTNLPDDGK